jgi:hypothetical protein
MKDAPVDVPWLKVFATGFKHGIKWAGVSRLFARPPGQTGGTSLIMEGLMLSGPSG